MAFAPQQSNMKTNYNIVRRKDDNEKINNGENAEIKIKKRMYIEINGEGRITGDKVDKEMDTRRRLRKGIYAIWPFNMG